MRLHTARHVAPFHPTLNRNSMTKSILRTGSSSGFGEITAYALANAGHQVFASMRDIQGHNQDKAEKTRAFAHEKGRDIRPLELDVLDDDSVERAIQCLVEAVGKIDVIVHNAGHMTLGPAEAFTPAQYAEQYDVNVLGTQRVNRAALPHMRKACSGLLVWVSSTSVLGGTPPWLAPYFAAKAAMESLAMSYAGELIRWGIETSIVAPGVFTHGTNHFANAGKPADQVVMRDYAEGPTRTLEAEVAQGREAVQPAVSDPLEVARAIVEVVGLPAGQRPLHVTVDPADMGYELVAAMRDRIRADVYRRMGLDSLLNR
jgi:NAD(P)-dependent dehydrogenase (short-subunit alcohol dehydrogenase family)